MSKASRKRQRSRNERARSDAERHELYMRVARKWLDTLDKIEKVTWEEAHLIAYNVLDSIEKQMLIDGYRPQDLPTYKRRLGGQSRADDGCFTFCKRCTCTRKDKSGDWYCTAFWAGPDKERYYVADGDGCARGIPRAEYGKTF